MSTELIALSFLIGFILFLTIATLIIAPRIYRKEKASLIELVDERIHDGMQGAIDAVTDAFGEVLTQPTVKSAMSIIGKQGGQASAENKLLDRMAGDMLQSPRFAGYTAVAEMLGLDLQGYIEDHGAARTITTITQLAQMAGINLAEIDIGSLANPGAGGGGSKGWIPDIGR